MSKCNATTAKKTQCSKNANPACVINGKAYCKQHFVSLGGGETPKPESKAKAAKSKEVEHDDDITFDLSSSTNSWLRPDSIKGVTFLDLNFTSVEHAYHFMRFYYPGADTQNIVNEIIASTSITEVRNIAKRNIKKQNKLWDEPISDISFTYGDKMLIDILLEACRNASFSKKLSKITLAFTDEQNTVSIKNYVHVLDLVRLELQQR